MPGKILCSNTDDHRPRAAVVRLSWPGGRFRPLNACPSCLRAVLYGVRGGEPDGDYPVLVSPLKPPVVAGYSPRAAIVRALSSMEGCDPGPTADVVLAALGMPSEPDEER